MTTLELHNSLSSRGLETKLKYTRKNLSIKLTMKLTVITGRSCGPAVVVSREVQGHLGYCFVVYFRWKRRRTGKTGRFGDGTDESGEVGGCMVEGWWVFWRRWEGCLVRYFFLAENLPVKFCWVEGEKGRKKREFGVICCGCSGDKGLFMVER